MSVLRGVSSPNTALTVLLDTSITSGTFYKFQYFGINQQGQGVPSDVFTIRAVTFPSKMNSPDVTYTGSGIYTITWLTPSNRGAVNIPISYYEVLFMRADGTYTELSPDCDGSDPDVVSTNQCEIPVERFTDPATFNLKQGDRIIAKIRATNEEPLTSVYSNPSTTATLIVVRPHKPPAAPIRNEAMTSRTMI